MASSRGFYGPLSNPTGSNDELTHPPVSQDNVAAGVYNLAPLRRRKSSTSAVGTGRSGSTPRRSSPLSGPQLVSENIPRDYLGDSARAGESSGRETLVQGSNLDNISLVIDDTKRLRLQHHFDPSKQFWKIFTGGLIRFLFTFLTALLLILAIFLFSKRQVISNRRKKWFNAINTGLSLALGMSLAHGFKAMVIDLRWWIISRQRRSLSEVDKILRSESLTVSLQLLLTAFGHKRWYNPLRWRWKLLLGCTLWLLANLAAQVAVALVGLNYSADVDDTFALLEPGNVFIPDLTQIYPVGFNTQSVNSVLAQQYTANSYGNMALGFEADSSLNIPEPGKLWSTGAYYFSASDDKSWIFVFLDSPPPPAGFGVQSVYTNRTINSTWSCDSWPVIQGGNGTVTNLTVVQDANIGENINVTLPFVGGTDQTTFMTTPNITCGTGCSIIEAFEASVTQPWYYKCNITVGSVVNGTRPEHEVYSSLRQMASAGIALQGYGVTVSAPGARQYQVYPSESAYGAPQDGYSNGMGALIAQFSIGVITAAAVYSNQSLWHIVPGMEPQIGNELSVSGWTYIWLILGLLVGAQGVGFVVAAFWANRVLIKDESIFATATLLRPIMEHLGDNGTAADGEVICDVLGDGPEMMVVYTTLHDRKNPGHFHLELGNHPKHRAFPEGSYD